MFLTSWLTTLKRSPRFHSRRRNRRAAAWQSRRLFAAAEVLEGRVMLDAVGAHVLSHTPDEVRNAPFDQIEVTFSEAIDAATFTTADVTLTGAGGPVSVTAVEQLAADQFRLRFAALERGTYRVTIGPAIADLAGNLLDQDKDGTAGEAAEDVYSASLVSIQTDVVFTTATIIAEGDTTHDGKHILIDGTTVTINGPHQFGSVHLVNGAVLTHSANSTTETFKLELTVAEQVIVDAASRIDVTGKGYLSGYTTGNTSAEGATGWGGGSCGGLGGSINGQANQGYGSYRSPDDWGSGGGRPSDNAGGPGGGLIRLTAPKLHLNGSVVADGGDYLSSGGGIFIDVDTLAGGGLIRAEGAEGGWFAFPSFKHSGGGGGGRIAVYASDFSEFDATRITAHGGIGSVDGGAGTVYLRDKDDPHGTLIIDGGSGGAGWAPLGLPSVETFTIPDDVVIRGERTHVGLAHSLALVLNAR